MFIFLQHKDIDKKKWDASISVSINKNIYGYSWFLDAVCPNWAGIIKEDYSVVMPLPSKKKMGILYLFQPFFSQQLGPFFRSESDAAGILNAIPSRYSYLEMKLNTFFHPDVSQFNASNNTNYKLTLDKSYEELFKSYAYNTKRNIKKCPSDLIITNEFDDSQAIDMFELNKGATLSNFKKESDIVLMKLIQTLKERSKLEKWAVYNKEGRMMAAAHFAICDKERIFLFSATDEIGKQARAMFFLFDQFIQKYSASGFTINFSGSNDVHVARFYSGFGAKKEIYQSIVKNRLPFFMRWLKR
ncbi:MAG: hypothetical protein JWM14_431 [Chitinophagaceae bacterium]|nr:hypothetical protein [Chitinophagaceae bacterium]